MFGSPDARGLDRRRPRQDHSRGIRVRFDQTPRVDVLEDPGRKRRVQRVAAPVCHEMPDDRVPHERQTAALQARLADARLAGLRAQINPHVLFNTLNAISVLAMKGDEVAVVRVVA